MTVKWLDKPEDHDYQAATDYLTLVGEADLVKRTVKALRNATLEYRKAKDILRAARLEMLPKTNAHVARDLAKIAKGQGAVADPAGARRRAQRSPPGNRRWLSPGVRQLYIRRKH